MQVQKSTASVLSYCWLMMFFLLFALVVLISVTAVSLCKFKKAQFELLWTCIKKLLIGWKKHRFELLSPNMDSTLSQLNVGPFIGPYRMVLLYLWALFQSGKGWILEKAVWPCNLTEGAWCVGGDFNEVLYSEDKNGRRTSKPKLGNFMNGSPFLPLLTSPSRISSTLNIISIHKPLCSKIDRFFASIQWLDRFSNTSLRGLPRPVSDHCPLLLDMDLFKDGPIPFKFENMWPRHRSFKQNVKEWWEEDVSARWAGLKL